MQRLVENMKAVLAKKKQIVRCYVYPPDTMIKPGQRVQIDDVKTGINSNFEVVQVEYNFDSETESLGSFSYRIEAVRLVD